MEKADWKGIDQLVGIDYRVSVACFKRGMDPGMELRAAFQEFPLFCRKGGGLFHQAELCPQTEGKWEPAENLFGQGAESRADLDQVAASRFPECACRP